MRRGVGSGHGSAPGGLCHAAKAGACVGLGLGPSSRSGPLWGPPCVGVCPAVVATGIHDGPVQAGVIILAAYPAAEHAVGAHVKAIGAAASRARSYPLGASPSQVQRRGNRRAVGSLSHSPSAHAHTLVRRAAVSAHRPRGHSTRATVGALGPADHHGALLGCWRRGSNLRPLATRRLGPVARRRRGGARADAAGRPLAITDHAGPLRRRRARRSGCRRSVALRDRKVGSAFSGGTFWGP